jgi:hypothetical protein
MGPGIKRTSIARSAAALGVLCGLLGLLSGWLDQTWKLGTVGWFTGGVLLLLIALFVLLDAAVAFQKARIIVVPKS